MPPTEQPENLDRPPRTVKDFARLFRATFEGVAMGIGHLAPDGRWLSANPRLCEMLGYEPDEILRLRFQDLTDPADLPDELQKLHAVLEGTVDSCVLRTRLRRGDGSWVRGEVTVSAVRAPGGRPQHLLAFLPEVREVDGPAGYGTSPVAVGREALENERLRLRTVLDLLPVGVWIADGDGRITDVNRSAREIWGGEAPATEALGRYHEDYRGFRPDGSPLEAGDWGLARAVQKGEACGPEEVRIVCFDGTRKTILNYGVPIRDEGGDVKGGVAVSLDITERKRAEDDLRDANERLAFLYRTVSKLLVMDRPRDFVQGVFDELTGLVDLDAYLNYLVEDRDGRRMLRLDSAAGVSDHLATELEWLELGSAVCGTVARDGRKIVVEDVQEDRTDLTASIRPMGITAYACHPLMAHGDVVGTLSFGTRSRPRFEAAELDLMQAVSNQVAAAIQRNRDREAERRARDEAEKANESKSAFMATVSHELRTPLNAIVGYTQLLEDDVTGPLEEGQRTYVERIGHGARQLQQLIEEILTFSRLEAGQEQAEIEEVTVDDLLQEVATVVEPLADEKGLAFRVERTNGPERLRTDALKLRQVLLNLLGNAVKYTAEGEVRLTIAMDLDAVVFEVQDTGPGISQEEQEKLFRPFWRSGSTRSAGGTGLGLTISDRYARLLGGEIRVRTDGTKGSVFELRLPVEAP